MDAEKLKELTERAAKATRVAKSIENVSEAKKFDDLDWALRDEALRLAKSGLLARLEAELNELLGENKPAVMIPTPMLPYQPIKLEPWIPPVGIGTIWYSDGPQDIQVRMQEGAA